MTAPLNPPRKPPYKLAGLALTVLVAVGLVLVYLQFRGEFTPKTRLTLLASRSGLMVDPGAKVTYNGVEIGRVAGVEEIEDSGRPQTRLSLEVNPKYLKSIPANVDAQIKAPPSSATSTSRSRRRKTRRRNLSAPKR